MATVRADSPSNNGHECPICLETFTAPRQLPCLHSFCEHCIQDYITEKASCTVGIFKDFMCPICRIVTSPSRKDRPVEEWASLFAQSPIPLVGKLEVERICDVCSSEKIRNLATKVCVVCEEFMCDKCAFYHQKMKISKTHQMITLEEWENNPRTRIRFTEGLGCPEHDYKDIEFYCIDHDTTCCSLCVLHHHKKCKEVLELKQNLQDLLKKMNPPKILNQIRDSKDHLKKFVDLNEESIHCLETQVSDITADVSRIRDKLNAVLDDFEKMVKLEGNRIYKEWLIRKQEQNHQCQSLLNAIRNSQALMEAVNQYGSDTQLFLVTSKTMKQLHGYHDQIEEEYERVDYIKISLELNSIMKALVSQDARGLLKIVCREEGKELHRTTVMRPLHERNVELSEVINIPCPSGHVPVYTGIVEFPEGDKLVSSYSDKTCYLYDSSYTFITSYTLPGNPHDLCLIDNNEVAVTMANQNTVQFLSIRDRSIGNTGTLKTRYKCFGVDAASREEIVVSGPCSETSNSNKCYWSLIDRNGKEKLYHEFICNNTVETFISLDVSKSRVYISVNGRHAVYSFDLTDGKQYFVYTSDDFKYPMGVVVDREDNVYVVGHGSNNIHILAADGVKLRSITSDVPKEPYGIFVNNIKDMFVITNFSGMRDKAHYFALK